MQQRQGRSSRRSSLIALTVALAISLAAGWWFWNGHTQKAPTAGASAKAATIPDNAPASGRPPAAVMLAKMKSGEAPLAFTRSQAERFIEQEGRSAVSLLLASVLCEGGDAWRLEAAARFPDDPMVASWMMPGPGNSTTPDARWVASMQQGDPRNALGWLFAARASLKEGRTEEGIALLTQAAGKEELHSYGQPFAEAARRAWLSAGYQELEADVASMMLWQTMQSHLHVMTLLSKEIRHLPQDQSDAAAKALLQMTARVNQPGNMAGVQEAMFANSINKNLAWTIDLHAVTHNPGTTAAERMDALRKEAAHMLQLEGQFNTLLPKLTDTELKQYLRRMKVEGELQAMEWAVRMKMKTAP